jgi:hypothetical protein
MAQNNYLTRLVKDLVPFEMFDYYDGPKFYSCQDKVGQLFLIYWIDETDDINSWLYLRVSQERYNALKVGNVSIAYTLTHPEEGAAFVVNTRGGRGEFTIEEISPEQVLPEWLPPQNDFLNLAAPTLPEKIINASEVAKRSNRQVIDLAFDKLSNSYEMGCGKLGKLLDAIQNVIYALACGAVMDIRRVPEEVKFKSEVLVTGLFASSFGVRLQSKSCDIFSTDEAATAIESLAKLIASLKAPELIPFELHYYNVLARSRFKHFLRILIDSQVSIKIDWGTPMGHSNQSKVSFNEILKALKKLEETDEATKTTIKRNGNLLGVDIESDFFALKIENNEIIKGRLAKSVSARHFDVPSWINATLEESCIIDPLTDREKWSYTLLDFSLHKGE